VKIHTKTEERKCAMWSWCVVDHTKKYVRFTAFKDLVHEGVCMIVSKDWKDINGNEQKGFKDAVEKLNLVINQGYKLFVNITEAIDPKAQPRKIKHYDPIPKRAEIEQWDGNDCLIRIKGA
jgi:ribulose bisphosphate carboxylase small subunit